MKKFLLGLAIVLSPFIINEGDAMQPPWSRPDITPYELHCEEAKKLNLPCEGNVGLNLSIKYNVDPWNQYHEGRPSPYDFLDSYYLWFNSIFCPGCLG